MRATTYFSNESTVDQVAVLVLSDAKGKRDIHTFPNFATMAEYILWMGDRVKQVVHGGTKCPDMAFLYQ